MCFGAWFLRCFLCIQTLLERVFSRLCLPIFLLICLRNLRWKSNKNYAKINEKCVLKLPWHVEALGQPVVPCCRRPIRLHNEHSPVGHEVLRNAPYKHLACMSEMRAKKVACSYSPRPDSGASRVHNLYRFGHHRPSPCPVAKTDNAVILLFERSH